MAGADPWGSGRAADAFVYADHPGRQLAAGIAGDGFVAEHHSTQSIFGIVGQSHSFVGITYGLDAEDRAEGFHGHDVHVVGAAV